MKIIGHRGARGLAPENTIASIQKAIDHMVDEVEFDVRVTKDDIPVLIHDEAASDAAGDTLVVKDTAYAELKAHKPDLTTLEAVLAQFGGKIPLYIEVKPDEPIAPIVQVIERYLTDGKTTDFCLASFSQHTLRELHAALPTVEKIVIERWSGTKAVLRARQVNARRLSMKYIWLWNGFLGPMKSRGWKVAAYTMNEPAKARKWHQNLYAIITDYPDRFEK